MSVKSTIRVGDRAVVREPLRFIRCGYESTPSVAGSKLAIEHPQEIKAFMESIGMPTSKFFHFDGRLRSDHRAVEKFLFGLGYLYTNATGFGGTERKIFTEYEEGLEGATVWITAASHCMTGIYYGPSGGGSGGYYGDDWDVEPGGLHDQTYNRIFEVRIDHRSPNAGKLITDKPKHAAQHGLWIEGRLLDKITEEVT